MVQILQVVTAALVFFAVVPSVAHALEMPGKMRLSKEAYLTVQPIYYPGFTIAGGIGEAAGLISTFILLIFTPLRSSDFYLTLIALNCLIGVQAIFWLFTQPVNKFWLRGEKLGGFSSGFFSLGSRKESERQVDWTEMRDQWEYSHLARAILSTLSFVLLIVAVSCL